MSSTPDPEGEANARRRRSDGERSRRAILHEAGQLATLEGIEGLSIGRLAAAVGMSKSGLFAHFGSKEELQLATIDAASEVFAARVVEPAVSAPTALVRLHRLAENYLAYVQDTFPGGCFFASLVSEMDTRPGPVRDRAVGFLADWLALLEQVVRDGQADGSIVASADPGQVAYEVEAALFLANAQFVALGTTTPIDRATAAIEARLAAIAATEEGAADGEPAPTASGRATVRPSKRGRP